MRTLLALEVLDRKVSAIAEWPLDSITLSGFSAIVLSILAAIATRYVLAYLGG